MLVVSSTVHLGSSNYSKLQFLICKICIILFPSSLPLFIENFSHTKLILLAMISAGAWKLKFSISSYHESKVLQLLFRAYSIIYVKQRSLSACFQSHP